MEANKLNYSDDDYSVRCTYIYIGEKESCVRKQTLFDDDSGRCHISIRGNWELCRDPKLFWRRRRQWSMYIYPSGEIESCVRTQNVSDDDDSGRCTDIHQGKVRAVSGPKTLLMTTTVSDVHATIRGKWELLKGSIRGNWKLCQGLSWPTALHPLQPQSVACGGSGDTL